jgi:tetratricopeptide (TPR) repeat protein
MVCDEQPPGMSPKLNPLTRGKKQKALALLQHDQPGEALPLLEQVCRADRRDTDARFMLAAAYQKLGAFEQAADVYRQVIALKPDYADAHYYLGNACLALGNGPAAIASFEQAIRLRPEYLEAHVNLGALLDLQHNFAAAETSFCHALRLDPKNAELHYSLGNVLQSQDQLEAAVDAYRQALALRPGHADTHNNLGNALARLERLDEAIRCYREALRIQPDLAAACNNLGNTLAKQCRFDEALASYRQSLAINPRYAEAQTNLGNIQRYQGKLADSIASHRHAIEFDPDYADAHFNLAFALLVAGEFREGWREYAWHWKREGANPRPFAPSAWDGADLGGRSVFLHAEQGIGDEIFFLRFAPELKRRGAGRIAYRPNKKIAALLTHTPVIDQLLEPTATPAADDRVFSVGDLPRLLDMAHGNQIPPSIPLAPREDALEIMRRRLAELGPPPYIGVTWRAGMPGKELVLYKASPLALLTETLKAVPATILILQRFPAEGEVDSFQKHLGRSAHDFSKLNDDLEAMLALLALIDDYIGVSNTNMHLRAAAGKTAKVLVPAPPEWRWMAEGKESPWFPGFTVYRQGYDGDWARAFGELTKDLAQVS